MGQDGDNKKDNETSEILYLNQNQYAKRAGVTRQRIHRLIQTHKIPLVDGKLNVAETDRILNETIDKNRHTPNMGGRPKKDGGKPKKSTKKPRACLGENEKLEPASPPPAKISPVEVEEDYQPGSSLLEEKTRREFWLANQAELKYKAEVDKLVHVDIVQSIFAEAMSEISKGMDSLGARLADDLASMTNKAEIKQLLLKETREIRKDSSEKLQALMDE